MSTCYIVVSESVMRKMMLLRPERPNRSREARRAGGQICEISSPCHFPADRKTNRHRQTMLPPITAPAWVSIVGRNNRDASLSLPGGNCWALNGQWVVPNRRPKHGEAGQIVLFFFFLVFSLYLHVLFLKTVITAGLTCLCAMWFGWLGGYSWKLNTWSITITPL